MRPTDRQVTDLWLRLEEWMAAQPFKPNQSQVAEKLGISTSALTEWKYGDSVPKGENLLALEEMTRIKFETWASLAKMQVTLRRQRRRDQSG